MGKIRVLLLPCALCMFATGSVCLEDPFHWWLALADCSMGTSGCMCEHCFHRSCFDKSCPWLLWASLCASSASGRMT